MIFYQQRIDVLYYGKMQDKCPILPMQSCKACLRGLKPAMRKIYTLVVLSRHFRLQAL